jgi:hypothetical protein
VRKFTTPICYTRRESKSVAGRPPGAIWMPFQYAPFSEYKTDGQGIQDRHRNTLTEGPELIVQIRVDGRYIRAPKPDIIALEHRFRADPTNGCRSAWRCRD